MTLLASNPGMGGFRPWYATAALAVMGMLAACGGGDGTNGVTAERAALAPLAADVSPPLSAGRYVLVSALSGHCVDAVPGTTDGGKVQQALCNNGLNQAFDVTLDADRGYKFLIVGTGRALDLNGGSTADGALIQQWSDNGSIAQRFLLRRSQGNRYSLVNAGSTKCVSIAGGSTSAGAGLQQASCDGQAAQQFLLHPQSGTSRGALALGQYSLRAVHSGLCLEIEGASTAAGAKMQQGTCTQENPQRFEVLPAANGSYQLQSIHSGMTLDVTGEVTTSGALIQQWPFAGGASRRPPWATRSCSRPSTAASAWT
jgi:hypothetical protein